MFQETQSGNTGQDLRCQARGRAGGATGSEPFGQGYPGALFYCLPSCEYLHTLRLTHVGRETELWRGKQRQEGREQREGKTRGR